MAAIVQLDEPHEELLNKVAKTLQKKKSEVVKEALDYYAQHVLDTKSRRLRQAALRVKDAEKEEAILWEGTFGDGL